jgi:uncharacterized protein (UPF0218 family)
LKKQGICIEGEEDLMVLLFFYLLHLVLLFCMDYEIGELFFVTVTEKQKEKLFD